MDENYNAKTDFDKIIEMLSSTDQSSQQPDLSNLYNLFIDTDMSLMSTSNVNNTEFQNPKPEDIHINSIDGVTFDTCFNEWAPPLTTINADSQLDMTTVSYDEQSQIQHSVIKSNRNIEIVQLNRLDDALENLVKALLINQNRLISRNVPRFLVFHTNHDINCALRMLLNAPVFIRVMLELKKVSERRISSSQLIQNTNHLEHNVQTERELFSILLKIIKITLEENRNEKDDIRLIQSFHDKYEALYSQRNNWIQQNPEKFCIDLMNILRTVANDVNQIELYTKAFEITSSVRIDDNEPQVKKEHTIDILSNDNEFSQYINKIYISTKIKHDKGHMITQKYEPLPEQILATDKRYGNNVPYSYPAEFQTCSNQRYLFTGAVTCHGTSFNCEHSLAVIRRQDSIYLFNSHRLIDRFHINYLPTFFKTVYGRILLYTEVEQQCGHICTFEDPLPEIYPKEPYHESFDYDRTQLLITTTEFNTSISSFDESSVIIRHPILTMFRYRMHSDFSQNNIKIGIPVFCDCLENKQLYFWPRSMFAGSFIECTLIFKAPDGQPYRSHFEFVHHDDSGTNFQNPTYVYIEDDPDEWFTLEFTISKSKQDAFQPKGEPNNDIKQSNQHNNICQIIHYPDGKIEKIDHEKLLSYKTNDDKKKTNRRKLNNNSQNVTPFQLSKVIDVNTVYLAFRPAQYLSEEERYVCDPNVVFISNGFKPVSPSVIKSQYDYSSNKLQITELSPLKITLLNENDTSIVRLSYLIPEMYRCTALKDKCIQVTILTHDDKEPRIHPIYQILNNQTRVSSMIFPAIEYSSTLSINVIKHTIDEFENDSELCQTLIDWFTDERTTPCITSESLKAIITSPGTRSFCIQLELCHSSNDKPIIYPKSTVISEAIIDESVSQETQVLPESLIINNTESTDTDLSIHAKRSLNEETNESFDLSSMKHHKVT